MKLIDAEALEEKIYSDRDRCDSIMSFLSCVLLRIADAPTVEANPVRHGKWVRGVFCSCCNRFPTKQGTGYDDRELTMYFEYCPHCGAKMDGGAEDDQKT